MKSLLVSIFSSNLLLFLSGCYSTDSGIPQPETPQQIEPFALAPVDISLKFSQDIVEAIPPGSSNGIDNHPDSEPPESSYHKRLSLTILDAENNPYELTVYLILSEASTRTWEVRARLDGVPLTAFDTNSDTLSNDEFIAFTSNGELDLNNSSNNAIIEYFSPLVSEENISTRLQLRFDKGNKEVEGDFKLNSLWLNTEGKGFFVTSSNTSTDEKLYTRVGLFRHDSEGFLVNRFDEKLLAFPTTSEGQITSTSLTTAIELNIANEIELSDGSISELLEIDISDSGLIRSFYQHNTFIEGKIALVYFQNPQDLITSELTSSLIEGNLTNPLTGEAQTSFFGEIVADKVRINNPSFHELPYSIKINGEGSLVLSNTDTANHLLSGFNGYRTDHSTRLVSEYSEQVLILETDEQGNLINPEFTELNDLTPLFISLTSGTAQETSLLSMTTHFPETSELLDPLNFNSSTPSTYHYSTTLTIYDSLSESHELNLFFIKTLRTTWSVFITSEDTTGEIFLDIVGGITKHALGKHFSIEFDNSGHYIATVPENISLEVDFGNGTQNQTIELNFNTDSSSEIEDSFMTENINQNDFTISRLQGIDINSEGLITANYANNKSKVIGQLALIKISNPECLSNQDGTENSVITDSCQYSIGLPNTEGFGEIEFDYDEY